MLRRRSFTTGALAAAMLAARTSRAETSDGAQFGDQLISGFRGTSPEDPEVAQTLRYLEAGQIAGVVLLKRNIRSPEQVHRLTRAIQEVAEELPAIVSIDQEGGTIARLGPENGFLAWASSVEIAQTGLPRKMWGAATMLINLPS